MTVLTTFAPSESVRRVETGSLRSAQPASGAGFVSLAMGEPGFDTPPAIRLAAHAAIECGYTHYAHPSGDPELREAIAAQLTGIGPTGSVRTVSWSPTGVRAVGRELADVLRARVPDASVP